MNQIHRNLLRSNNYIPVWELESGAMYRIISRNAYRGIWISSEMGFAISREKYGIVYPFLEYHWDVDNMYGTVKPFEYIEKSPFNESYITSILSTSFGKPSGINGDIYYGPKDFHDYMNEEDDDYSMYYISKYQ